ncbi:MAG TPA: hypothetical protein VMH79_11025 [Thermoanaerobaculia bacterium]|nr:hypothetical protein [Thermoanaerobaculia bacterium]
MAVAALAIGLFIAALGALGVAVPEAFIKTIAVFQAPPGIYLAGVLRVAAGVVLIGAARSARLPKTLRTIGALIAIGGLATPFVGVEAERVIMDWWAAAGPLLTRAWGLAALLVGVVIACAARPRRPGA